MIRFSKIILFFTAVVLMAWLLPWGYHFVTVRPDSGPFTLYSCMTDGFVMRDYRDGNPICYDETGRTYSEREFDSVLPLFYYRQLLADGRQPDTLRGVALTPQVVSLQSFMFRSYPSDLNKVKPKLYPLLEAMSGRVDLQMPPDVFRMGERIEFIDMATNRVDESKSERFTQALLVKGFSFPATYVQGNPTTRKEYDEGYMLLDRDGKLFHLETATWKTLCTLCRITRQCTDYRYFRYRIFESSQLCLLSDSAHRMYLLTNPGYELKQLPIDRFDPRTEEIMIIADLFHWTVCVSGDRGTRYYAVDANDYSLCGTLSDPSEVRWTEKVAKWVFPFELSFTSYDDEYVYPRLTNFSVSALVLNLLLAGIYLLVLRRQMRDAVIPACGVVILGLYLFLPLLVLRR